MYYLAICKGLPIIEDIHITKSPCVNCKIYGAYDTLDKALKARRDLRREIK